MARISSLTFAFCLAWFKTPWRTARSFAALCVVSAWLSHVMFGFASAQEELPTRIIEGRVTNSDGEPIKGAAVEWGHFLAEKEGREVFRTNADGKYRVETTKVGPDFRLGVSAIGFAPAWRDDLIPPRIGSTTPLTMDFKLTAPISLRGKVVDEEGKPIEGARVVAQSPVSGFYSSFSMPTPSFPFPGPSREAVTNADGEFLIRYLPATAMLADDADKGHSFEVSIKTGTGTTPRGKAYAKLDNRIEINRSYLKQSEERDGKIRGRVIDEETEQPIEKFKVVLRHTAGMREITSKEGEFLLDQLYSNYSVQFFIYAEGYAPFVARPTTSADNGTFVECQLKRKPGLKGIVVDSSRKPIQGAEIVFGFDENKGSSRSFYWGSFKELVDGFMGLNFVQRAVTKDDGRFEFAVVDQQPVVAVIAPGFARQLRFIDPSEVSNLQQSDLQLELQPESVISGVVKMNGKPVSNADLRLSTSDNWNLDFGQIKADEKGCFAIQNLSPGTYLLSVYQNSGHMSTSRLTKKIVLEARVYGTSERPTNLVLDNPGGSSSLRGKATPFSMLLLTPAKLEGQIEIEYTNIGSVVSPEGDFEIRGLHPGTYTCHVTPATTSPGFISRGASREVVVQGDTVLDVTESAVFQFP